MNKGGGVQKKRPLIIGNWKMNGTIGESLSFAQDIVVPSFEISARLVLCPSYVFLPFMACVLKGSPVKIGAQNCSGQSKGALTGEISVPMLKGVGCSYVLLGHSERRQLFREMGQDVLKKVLAVLGGGLIPVVCVGESLEDYRRGTTRQCLEKQITESLPALAQWKKGDLVLAYEPVWSIGTGQTPTFQEVKTVHVFLKDCLKNLYGDRGRDIPIIYGGSVTPENAKGFLTLMGVEGVLVGGASLNAKNFLSIARSGC